MKLIVTQDYEEMSRRALQIVADCLKEKPDALICLPGGHTPRRLMELFVEAVNRGEIDIEKAYFVQLDDWVGVGKDDYGSCSNFLTTTMFDKMQKKFADVFLFDGARDDIDAQLEAQDDFVRRCGPIDLTVLGIGMNGHLGFNEEGVDFSKRSHRITLSRVTLGVQDKYFDGARKHLTEGITLGIAQIMEAKKAVVIADGAHKADIVRDALTAPIGNQLPATVLRQHANSVFLIDAAAAAKTPVALRERGEVF